MPPTPDSIRHLANAVASEIEAQYGKDVPVRAALDRVDEDLATDVIVKRVLPADMGASYLAGLASMLTKDTLG